MTASSQLASKVFPVACGSSLPQHCWLGLGPAKSSTQTAPGICQALQISTEFLISVAHFCVS